MLLERTIDLARISERFDDAAGGHGGVMVIEGPAGIGKTALLEAARDHVGPSRHLQLRARGGELEREFPHGVVRQLFEEHLHALTSDQRKPLLRGAAALAAPVISPEDAPSASATSSGEASFALTHGLYWLTSNLAEQAPLLITVDDLQWSDVASLRFLVHLARRVDEMSVLMIVGMRVGEPDAPVEFLEEIAAQPAAEILRPKPLSHEGVARLIADRLSEIADEEFVAACHRATGGTPLLVRELVEQLGTSGIRPIQSAAPEVDHAGPPTVARAVLQRLERLPRTVGDFARAVAILGAEGQMHRAARLAGIDQEEAATATDALAAIQILRPGRPLDFVHPIVRNAVYHALPAAARAIAHARAAELLGEEGADLDAVAAHHLLAEPSSSGETVARLRAAAQRAAGRGAFESATTYLRRALEEGGLAPHERASLLLEMGLAQRHVDPQAAIECLAEAHRYSVDASQRALIACHLADNAFYGRWPEAVAVVEAGLAEAEGIERELRVRLEMLRVVHDFYLQRLDDFFERLPHATSLASAETPAGRLMALHLAGVVVWLVQPPDEVRRLLDLGLRGNHLVDDAGPEDWLIGPLFNAMTLTEELDEALSLSGELVGAARRRGSIVGFAHSVAARSWVHARRGDLLSAEADARAGLPILREHGFIVLEVGTIWYLADAIIERPELDDEAERLVGLDVDALLPVTYLMAVQARGVVRLARGDVAGGTSDLRRCEAEWGAHGTPNGWSWRLPLALAVATSDTDEAMRLVQTHLKAGRRVGLPRAVGTGLRTLGLLVGGPEGIQHLEEAVRILERSPARLEHARALVELGAARRRAGERVAAREPLRLGLDLARRSGATRLEDRARTELVATGARPRRALLTGRDALTATEQRLAEMAASGMSNPEIAQALFVTRKTVENHLARIYPKLGIHSRTELSEALQRAGDPVVG